MSKELPDQSAVDEKRIEKAQRDVRHAKRWLYTTTALSGLSGAALAGGIAFIAAVAKLFGEMGVHANRLGFSIFEIRKDKKLMGDLGALAASHPESMARLKPYVSTVMIAPLAGAALSGWAAYTYQSGKIKSKQQLLDQLPSGDGKDWQKKILHQQTAGHGKNHNEAAV